MARSRPATTFTTRGNSAAVTAAASIARAPRPTLPRRSPPRPSSPPRRNGAPRRDDASIDASRPTGPDDGDGTRRTPPPRATAFDSPCAADRAGDDDAVGPAGDDDGAPRAPATPRDGSSRAARDGASVARDASSVARDGAFARAGDRDAARRELGTVLELVIEAQQKFTEALVRIRRLLA